MEGKPGELITVPRSLKLAPCQFLGGSGARIIVSGGEAALMRPLHDQNAEVKSQRCLAIISRDPRHTSAHAAKSSRPQTQSSRPIRGKCSRTFMTGVRTFMKACAILGQRLYATFRKTLSIKAIES
jgi:hypothetical protein